MMTGDQPVFTLGIKFSRIVIFSVIAAISISLLIYLGDLGVVHKPGIIYQILSYLAFACAFIFVFSFLGVIVGLLARLRVGYFLLFDDHLELDKKRTKQRINYEELKDAYFGDISTRTYNTAGAPTYNFSRVASFYIGEKRYTFRERTASDGTKLSTFLEARIPKKNIDVEDDGDVITGNKE